jgi:hypothetical protein
VGRGSYIHPMSTIDPTSPNPEMMRYGRGQNTASNTVPLARGSTWEVFKWRAKGFLIEVCSPVLITEASSDQVVPDSMPFLQTEKEESNIASVIQPQSSNGCEALKREPSTNGQHGARISWRPPIPYCIGLIRVCCFGRAKPSQDNGHISGGCCRL